jgi:hypothetical protein
MSCGSAQRGAYGVLVMLVKSGPSILLAIMLPFTMAFLLKDCTHPKANAGDQMANQNTVVRSLQNGMWGGDHIRLEVSDNGSQVDYDCAHGTIDQKIVLDAKGGFEVQGTHVRERGGPVRKDDTADSHPASYSGRVDGNRLFLTVTESDTKTAVGTFALTYGDRGKIVRCR